jgi:predicted enzyme related to lactoylglutathione lyase
MTYISSHFGLHVRDLATARRFYVDQLGLPVLQDTPSMKLLAVRAGDVRLSIFGDRGDASGEGPCQIILATEDLAAAIEELKGRGLSPINPPAEAPGFMKFINILDPDGNRVGIVEYLRDPLAPI